MAERQSASSKEHLQGSKPGGDNNKSTALKVLCGKA